MLTVRDRIDIEGPENVRVVYERLRVRLESSVEDSGTRMLFVGVRRSLGGIAADVGLMVDVARRLRSLDRWEGRARLPGRLRCAFRYHTRVSGRSYWFSWETLIFSNTLLRFCVNFMVLFTSF